MERLCRFLFDPARKDADVLVGIESDIPMLNEILMQLHRGGADIEELGILADETSKLFQFSGAFDLPDGTRSTEMLDDMFEVVARKFGDEPVGIWDVVETLDELAHSDFIFERPLDKGLHESRLHALRGALHRIYAMPEPVLDFVDVSGMFWHLALECQELRITVGTRYVFVDCPGLEPSRERDEADRSIASSEPSL